MTTCLLLTAAGMGFSAANEDESVYTRERAFRIPLEMTEAERKAAAWIRLMVSTDSGKTWSRVREESPKRSTVTFRAPGDGCYWLALAVVGHDEKMRPANPADLKAGLKVVIDTAKPEVALEAVKTRSGLRGVRWTVKDGAPEAKQALKCAVWDEKSKAWKPRSLSEMKNSTIWFGRNEAVTKMQLAVADAAGNEAVAQIDIDGDRFLCADQEAFILANRAPTPTQFAESAKPRVESRTLSEIEQASARSAEDGEKLVAMKEKNAAAKPAEKKSPLEDASPLPPPKKVDGVVKQASAEMEETMPALPDDEPAAPAKPKSKAKKQEPVAEETVEAKPKSKKAELVAEETAEAKPKTKKAEPAAEETVETKPSAKKPTADGPAVDVSFSNRRSTVLHYEMTSVPKGEAVELWGVKDGSKDWVRIGRDEDGASPMEAMFPSDGRWGILLVYGDASGSGKPAKDDAPSTLVEVDTKKPQVTVGEIRKEKNRIRLAWKATDAHMLDDCVRVSFSRDQSGPWETIAVQLAADGEYLWKPTEEAVAKAVYFRFDATDRAGNIGSVTTAKPLKKASEESEEAEAEKAPVKQPKKEEVVPQKDE